MKKQRGRGIDLGVDDDDDSRDGDMFEGAAQEKLGNANGVIKDIEYLKNMNID